jgi:hypothetical protein
MHLSIPLSVAGLVIIHIERILFDIRLVSSGWLKYAWEGRVDWLFRAEDEFLYFPFVGSHIMHGRKGEIIFTHCKSGV